jgi:hypothetical protein
MFEGMQPGAPVKSLWISMCFVAMIGLVGLVVMRIAT